mgnify:CR=1 FL=1
MSDRDFEIESLSSYLDLPAGQVLRMADRGQLPGRKVSVQVLVSTRDTWVARFTPGPTRRKLWLVARSLTVIT